MRLRPALLCLNLLLALGVAAALPAQERHDQAVLPVVDPSSGKIQAWLLLEPETSAHGAGTLIPTRNAALVNRLGARFGLSSGEHRGALPMWLSRSDSAGHGHVDVNDLTLFARKPLGTTTYLSIAGTMTRATLLPYAAAPADLGRAWNSRSLAVGGGYGAFSVNIIGQVVDSPGQQRWENVGLGLTWHTPWSGQLTVGANNIVTSGRNPFSPRGETRDEGTVPYVRYEQDF